LSVNGDACVVDQNVCVRNGIAPGSTMRHGIKLYNSAQSILSANVCMNNAGNGIEIDADHPVGPVTVVGNTCVNSSADGPQQIGINVSPDVSSLEIGCNVTRLNRLTGLLIRAQSVSAVPSC
jgi:hypothetical protein